MEWIILICALGSAAYLYYYKRPFFDKHRGFIEFSLIIFTALFTIYQVRSSAADFNEIVDRMDSIITKAEESSTALQNVEQSLSNLPPQLDALSESINSFDDVISTQRKQMTITLNELSSSVLAFKTTVDSMVERFNRKPDIDIELLSELTDSTRLINTIVVTNNGKLLADIYMMRFMIDTSSVISVTQAKETDHWGMFVNYQVDYFSPAPVYGSDRIAKFTCNFVLKNSDFTILRVIVFYRASFGNDGTKKAVFVFEKDQVNYKKFADDKDLLKLNKLPNR